MKRAKSAPPAPLGPDAGMALTFLDLAGITVRGDLLHCARPRLPDGTRGVCKSLNGANHRKKWCQACDFQKRCFFPPRALPTGGSPQEWAAWLDAFHRTCKHCHLCGPQQEATEKEKQAKDQSHAAGGDPAFLRFHDGLFRCVFPLISRA